MIAGETSVGANGKQNALFPLDCLYITQGENTGSSHVGMDAIDFVGWNGSRQINQYPYYAPFDCKFVAYYSQMKVWESLDQVNFIDGYTGIATIGFGHDDDRTTTVGTIKRQGELIGHTGTYGASDDHVHMEVVKGVYAGFEQVPATGYYKMKNSVHIYNSLGINDTVVYRPLSYNWREFAPGPGPIPPGPLPDIKKRKSYPFYLRRKDFTIFK